MEALKLKRTPLRASFTRFLNELSDLVLEESPDMELLEALFEKLKDKQEQIQKIDEELLNAMIESKASEDNYNKEYEACEVYREKFLTMKVKIRRMIDKMNFTNGVSEENAKFRNNSSMAKENTQSPRLPELKLVEFDGRCQSWLNFWHSFKKIHENQELDNHSKFIYLIQAMTPNTKAREIIESYPTSGENYPKVIQHLQDRFGRDDMLIEIYVRELLQLVLSNNNSKRDTNLSKLYDSLETKLRALESLGVSEDKYASILQPLVESCLPQDTLIIWERSRDKSDTKKGKNLKSILEFVRNEVISEERILLARSSFGLEKNKKSSKSNIEDYAKISTASDLIVGEKLSNFNETKFPKKIDDACIFCEKSNHASNSCFKARSMTYESKKNLVLKKKLCFVCLRKNHLSRNCRTNIKCVICGKRHLAVFCPNISLENESTLKVGQSSQQGSKSYSDNLLMCNQKEGCSEILLQTLIVRVSNGTRERFIRSIIDTGCQRSYLAQSVIEEMQFEKCGEITLRHKLFGGVETNERLHKKYKIKVSSVDYLYDCDILCLNENIICSDVKKIPRGPWVTELNKFGIRITDVENSKYEVEKEIKLLIGSDIAGKLLTGGIKSLKSGPIAVQTRLGWVLMGEILTNEKNMINNSLAVVSLLNESSAANLWKLEIMGITDPSETKSKSEIHEETLKYFKNTISLDPEGRYEIALPWVLDNSRLSSNRELAEKRLVTTWKKLADSNKIGTYQEVFEAWLNAGIIERVTDTKESQVHYLPHRPVFKEASQTTRVRPVFDASAHSKGFPSLNDCLDKGPNLIEIIPAILNRFRRYPYAVVSDIEKAFLQIGIREKDRDYLRFLWKNTANETLVCRHRRVAFGLNCSPFLLAATLNYHCEKAPDALVETAKTLIKSLYVDNCVSSFKTREDLDKFIVESRILLSSGKFNLRGWHTNSTTEVISETPQEDCIPVLGLNWDLKRDTLSCKIDYQELDQAVVSKRTLLSSAHRVFDPIGFTSPVTLLPKLLLQDCWKYQLKWDDTVPEHIEKQFLKWCKDMSLFTCIEIPRCLNLGHYELEASLHIFCDASELAYATCIFLRVKSGEDVSVTFLQSKARVAPLKNISVPRLELLACCIGARLATSVINDLNIHNLKIIFWTDSSTALCWIQRDVRWGTFVWNRVEEIRNLTAGAQWRHIPGNLNPADLPSRGCTVARFLQLKWWEGPSWLKEPESSWPQTVILPDEEIVNAEKRKSVISSYDQDIEPQNWYFKYFSSYIKTVRCMGWILRFIENLKGKTKIQTADLTYSEVERAERKIIMLVQQEKFGKRENISALRPLIDSEGLIRVKTQVEFRKDTTNYRYPILLPSDHPVVHRLIFERHVKLLHGGVTLLMSDLRENYWIIKARKTIRTVVQRCVKCKRFKAKKIESIPIGLPTERVENSRVFQTVGVDLAGPLYLKDGKKSWIILYTCAVYRAVHLDLVTALSTEAFLRSFRRFIARRGRPTTVFSDNGTNFVGTNKALSGLDWQKISSVATIQKIRWKFNPPTAAWWGGWWERLIQMLKRILRKILGKAVLTYEELITILCDCEEVMNSRPLTYVTEDLDDLPPLKPSMFLQDASSSDVSDIDAIDGEVLNKRIRYVQKIREHLRERFRTEYLGQLKQQTVRRLKVEPLAIDDVVLLESDKKRAFWSLARVIELIPGKDGIARVAKIKTESGELVRPIQKLYHLEMQKSNDNNFFDNGRFTRYGRKVTVPERLNYT